MDADAAGLADPTQQKLPPPPEVDVSNQPVFLRPGYDGPTHQPSAWENLTAPSPFSAGIVAADPMHNIGRVAAPVAHAAGEIATRDLGFGTPPPDPMDEFRQPNYTAGLSAPNVPAPEPGAAAPNPVVSGIAKGVASWLGLSKIYQDNAATGAYAWDSQYRQTALADYTTQLLKTIKEKSGADFPNPANGGYGQEASQLILDRIHNGELFLSGERYTNETYKTAYQLLQNDLQTFLAKHQTDSPEDQRIRDAVNPSLTAGADLFAKDAQTKAQADYAKSSGYLLPWLAEQAGYTAGFARHPINTLSLLPWGSGVRATTVLGRMAVSGLEQAGIVGAATAVQEPGLQERRAQLGEEHGLVPALKDVGESALFGALPGVLFQGIHEIFARFGPQAGPAVTEEFLRRQRVQDFLNEARAAPGGPEADAARTASAADAAARRAREANMSNGAWIRKEIDDFLAELEAREKAARAGAAPPPGAEPSPAGAAAPEPPPSPPAGGGGLAEAKLSFENEPPPPPADGGAGGAAVLASTERNVAGRAEGAPAIPGAILNLPRTTQVTGAAIENADLDAASAPPAVPGVSPQEHLAAYEGMVQHLENPEQVAKPILPEPVPDAGPVAVPPDRAGLPEPKTEPGEVHEYDGKPILYTRFDPRTLGTDAQAFQYKGGADQAGVTNRLAGVRRWEPLAAGNAVVYERADGKRFIVDGHQRQGLATRLLAQGHPPIRFNGALLKETDGWTVADARAVAAKKNIQEGSGETLDTARMLRDRPDMWDQSLPTSSPKLKQAKGLAELSDEAWGMMLNGVVPENYASLVGQGVPDQSVQASVLGDIARANIPKVGGENQVRMIIADANALGAVKQMQTDIFGTYEATRTYLTERAKVYSAVVKLLKDDKRVFSMLDREAERIEAAGNVLVDANADQAARADQLAQILSALASRTGPVSAALNRSAEAVANGTHVQVAARAFLRDIDRLIREEGLKLQIPPAIEVPEPSPLDLDTPAGRETQTKELEADALARPAPAEPMPKTVFEDFRDKLLDAGVSADVADAQAALMQARYETRAVRLGMAPEQGRDLYQQEGWDIRHEDTAPAEAGADTFFQPPTVPTFYSAVERAVTGAKLAKGSPEQWLATIRNTAGVRPEEMQWLGLEDWLKGQKGAVTREAVADYVRANEIKVQEITKGGWPDLTFDQRAMEMFGRTSLTPAEEARVFAASNAEDDLRQGTETKFDRYALPGGQNYRELLLTLPDRQRAALEARAQNDPDIIQAKGWLDRWREDLQEAIDHGWEADDVQEIRDRVSEQERYIQILVETPLHRNKSELPQNFGSSHWDEPNIVSHVRFDDRVIDGQRALHIAEVQSDWHQAGRRKGYAPANPDPMEQRPYGEVPDAPFKTTWPELAMKRMIRFASENGYGRVTWDTGATAAERFDLSKQISKVTLSRWGSSGFDVPHLRQDDTGGNNGLLTAYDHNGRKVIDKYVDHAELPDIVGKDIADKLLQQPEKEVRHAGTGGSERSLEGLDLKVGGEGMKGFYDKILPAAVAKLTKKFGGKVETATLPGTAKPGRYYVTNDGGRWRVRNEDGVVEDEFSTEAAARGAIERFDREDRYTIRERATDGRWEVLDQHGNFMALAETEEAARSAAAEWTSADTESGELNVRVHSLTLTPALKEAALSEGFPLFQPGKAGPRASVTLRDNQTIVRLFGEHDPSKLIHEAGHKFLSELAADAAREGAPAQLAEDLDTVLKWLGAENPESVTREQHEKFATGFERYAATGNAPSEKLKGVFERFKQWLMQIYRRLTELGKKIPDEIRQVFDRMLATDEEIAAAARETPKAEPAPEPKPASEHPVEVAARDLAENAKRALEASGTPADMIAHEFVTKGIEPLIDRAFPKAAAPPVVTGFQTSKGSTYVLHTDGTTTRNKTLHAGHEARDVGVKPQSARTIYVDKDVASNLSGAGLTEHGGKGYRLVLRDGKATLLSWNKAAEKWGASPGSRDIPFTTTPEVGKSPVEAWKPATDVPGYEAYRGQHAGNEITSITHAEPAATDQAFPNETGPPKTMHEQGIEVRIGARERLLTRLRGQLDNMTNGSAYEDAVGRQRGYDERLRAEIAKHEGVLSGFKNEVARLRSARTLNSFPGVEAQALMRSGPAPANSSRVQLGPDGIRAQTALRAADENLTAAGLELGRVTPDYRNGKISDAVYLAARKLRDDAMKHWDAADIAFRDAVSRDAQTEAGPGGTRQTLAPGIAPVTDADRLRAAAAKPMTGGAKALPEGGLFDETARAQPDLLDMSMADRWAAERRKILETVPHEAVLSKLVGECQI